MRIQKKHIDKALIAVVLMAGIMLADDPKNVGALATEITKSFAGITKLMIGMAYVAGIGFGVAGIFKFKQHKDNPTQVPIGTPIAMLAISAALVFLPGLYSPLGATIFGQAADDEAGGDQGTGSSKIPGFSSSSTAK